jgi:hypothetical protein
MPITQRTAAEIYSARKSRNEVRSSQSIRERESEMNRIEIVRPLAGLCGMIVCVEPGVTNEEILEFCNRENPSGVENGWSNVVRDDSEGVQLAPLQCQEHPTRTHLMVIC